MSIWSTNHTARVARQGRVDERRIDACLEILRLVEHRTFWFERRVARAELAGDDPYEVTPVPPLPQKPEVGEEIVIETLLVAFGSAELQRACTSWSQAVAQMDSQLEIAAWNYNENYEGPTTPTSPADLAELKQKLEVLKEERRTIEVAIRQEVMRIQGGPDARTNRSRLGLK